MSQVFSPPAPLSPGTPQLLAAWIVSGACLLATGFAWHDVTRSQLQEERTYFERQTANAVVRIEQALTSCEQVLRSVPALVDSRNIPSDRWSNYAAALSSAPPVPGIQAIGFTPATAPGTARVTPKVESDGSHHPLKIARIAAVHPDSNMIGTPRELWPELLPASAHHHSSPQATDDIRHAQDISAGSITTLMYIPFRLHVSRTETDSRSRQLLGYAYARVGIREFIEHALGETDHRFRIRLFEGRSGDQQFLLYDSSNAASDTKPNADTPLFNKTADIDLNGNHWTIQFDAPQESWLSSDSNRRAGTYILVTGLILALSLFSATRAIARSRQPVSPHKEQSRQELKNLVDALETLRDQEQKRLAQEMHDDLGQLLAAMKMDLAGLADHVLPTDSKALHRLDNINELVNTMMTSVRRIISDLPPKALEDLGLFDALRLLAKNFEKRHQVRCHVCLPENAPCIPQKAASAIYRMVQESLTNVAKHACATDVEISMEVLDNRVLLSIVDNGKGFSAQALQKAGSFGLIGMRERAASLNGGMKVESALGAGTTIYITLPLNEQQHSATETDAPSILAEGI